MIERTFDSELAELNDMILKMGNMAQTAIAESIEALKAQNEKNAREIIKDDKKIDQIELDIDEKCIVLLATRQPMATDLRFIATAMKITTDIERIGDLAVDVCEKNIEMINVPLVKPLIDTPKLAQLAQDMLRESLDTFVKRDPNRSIKIHEMEKEADRLRNIITDELIEIMSKDPTTVPRGVSLLLISRFFERMCDHAMNIAEDVVYMVEAKVIKHLHVHDKNGGESK